MALAPLGLPLWPKYGEFHGLPVLQAEATARRSCGLVFPPCSSLDSGPVDRTPTLRWLPPSMVPTDPTEVMTALVDVPSHCGQSTAPSLPAQGKVGTSVEWP